MANRGFILTGAPTRSNPNTDHRMKTRALLAVCTATFVLAGCKTEAPTAPVCDPIESSVASTSGDTVTTTTGLRYIETQVGTGATAEWCQPVAPVIAGYLTDGTVFQPTIRYPFRPGVDPVIPGFAEGVVGLRDGGARRLIIPPQLGYGNNPPSQNGQPVVPPNSTLIFDVSFPVAGTP